MHAVNVVKCFQQIKYLGKTTSLKIFFDRNHFMLKETKP